MMRRLRWLPGACGCLILTLSLASSSDAQVSEVDYKTLYAGAEYDKALEVVASLDSVEAQQYKALCLLALGRQGAQQPAKPDGLGREIRPPKAFA